MLTRRATKTRPLPKKSRKILSIFGTGAVMLAGLAGAVWAPPSHAVEGFPVIDPGQGTAGAVDTNWDRKTNITAGGTYTSDGWLRLVDNGENEITNILNKQSFSSSTGFIADFDYRLTGGQANSTFKAGDGFSFYLTDGDATVTNGGAGMGLAYATSNTTGLINGVADGVLGVGFDAYGGFGDSFNYSSGTCIRGGSGNTLHPNSVGVRGSGNVACGEDTYPLLGGGVTELATLGDYSVVTSTDGYDDPATVADSTYRHVRITLKPAATTGGDPTLDVEMSDAVAKDQPYTTMKPIITGMALDVTVPENLKLGFGASTGEATAFTDLRNISISALSDLSINSYFTTTQPTDGYVPGASVIFVMNTKDLGPTSLQPGTGQGSGAEAMMVADLSSLGLTSDPVLMAGPTTSNGAVSGPQYTDGKAMANWWSDVSTTAYASMTVRLNLPDNIPAGDYTIPTYIPTDFDNYTLNQANNYITPDKTASDPNLKNNLSTLSLTVAQVPSLAWGKATATLASGDTFKAGSTVDFTFPFTNTGNTPVSNVVADLGPFSGADMPTLTCTPDTVDMGAAGQCTGSYVLDQADIDNGGVSLSATATGSSSNGTSASTGKTAAILQQQPAASVSLTKTATAPDTMAEGQDVVYTFVATNTGDATLTDLNVDDSAGFGGTGTLPAAQCDEDTLAPGASTNCTVHYPLTQADVDGEGFSNHATATAKALANAQIPGAQAINVTSPSASASFHSIPKSSLVLVKTGKLADGQNFEAGAEVDYTFTLTNNGATTLSLSPTSMVSEVSISGGGVPPTVDCSGAASELQPGKSTQCTALYYLTQDNVNDEEVTNIATGHATFTPTGSSTSIQVDSENATSKVTGTPVGGVSLTATATSPSTWSTGEQATLKFSILNSGQLTLTDPAVTIDSIDGGGQIPTVTCDAVPAGGLQPNQSLQCSAQYTLTQQNTNDGKVTFSATATATTPESQTVTSEAADGSFSGVGAASMTITKTATAPAQFVDGQKVDYSFTIQNTGAVTLSDVAIADNGPIGGTGAWTAPADCETTLAPDATTTCSGEYTLTQDDVNNGVVTNTALASANTPEGLEVKAAASTVSAGPNVDGTTDDHRGKITVTLQAGTVPSPAAIGAEVPFTATITNAGPVTLQDIKTAISGLEVGADAGQYQVDCPAGEVQPADTITCDIKYYLTANDLKAGDVSLTATSTAESTLGIATDPATSNPAEATFPIPGGLTGVGSVALVDGQPYKAGSEVKYTINVSDTGQTPLSDVAVGIDSFSGTGPAPTFTCVPDTLVPDGSAAVCTATYTLTQADVDNAFSATPGPLDMNTDVSATTGNPPNAHSTTVKAGPLEELLGGQPVKNIDVSGTAPAFDPADLKAGNTVTFPFTVTNNGDVTLSDVAAKASTGAKGALSDVTCTPQLGTLDPGDTADCSVTYTLDQADVDNGGAAIGVSATGKYGSEDTDVVVGSYSPAVSATPIGTVKLTKTVEGPSQSDFKAGAPLHYTFLIENTGNATLSGLTLTEGDFTGSGAKPVPSCPDGSLDSLAPGQSITCTADYALTQDDVNDLSVANTASVNGLYFKGTENAQSTSKATFNMTATNGISIVQTVTSLTDPTPGDVLNYKFEVTNTGALSLSNWKLESTDFTGKGQFGAIDCPDAGSVLEPGQTVTCTATYAVDEGDLEHGPVSSTVKVTADSSEGQVSDSSTVVSTLDASYGVSLVKTAALEEGQAFAAGSKVDFTFKVTNTGSLDMNDFNISEDPSFTGTGTVDMSACENPGPLAWDAAPYTCVGTYELTQADVDAGGFTNTATVNSNFTQENKPVTASDSSTIGLTGVAYTDISLDKTVSDIAADKFLPGAEVNYGFTVTNTGVSTLTDVALTDTEFSGSGELGAITCDNTENLAPGAVRNCQATYKVTQADVDAQKLVNTASVTATTLKKNVTAEDTSTATLQPQGIVSSIQVSDTAVTPDGAKLKQGSDAKFKIKVVNDGVTTLKDISVQGYVIAGDAAGTSESTASSSASTKTITVPSGATKVKAECASIPQSLEPGASFECTVTTKLTLAELKAGAVSSFVTATGTNDLGTTVSATAGADIAGLKVPVAPPHKLAVTGADVWAILGAFAALAVGVILVQQSRRRRF